MKKLPFILLASICVSSLYAQREKEIRNLLQKMMDFGKLLLNRKDGNLTNGDTWEQKKWFVKE